MLPTEYQWIDTIHASGVSRILLVDSPDGERLVAKLPPMDSPTAARRFQREIKALKNAAGPHVMPIIRYGYDYSWYLMPQADRALSSEIPPTDLESAIEVLEAITHALRPIHEIGEVHRDLKPDNILWLDDGKFARWVVSDFGIIRNPLGNTTHALTATEGLLGTRGWAAPEQDGNAHNATPATDVYSAGAIIMWMLTGQRPRVGLGNPLSGSPIAGAVAKATSARSNWRFQNLDDFLKECKRQARDALPRIEDLVASQHYGDIYRFILQHPSERDDVVDAIGKMSQLQVRDWHVKDPHGLAETVKYLCDSLADDIGSLNFASTVDPFLILGVHALRLIIRSDAEQAQQVGATLFFAIAEIHQYAPATEALDWLENLSDSEQELMRMALQESGAWDFFGARARLQFTSKRQNRLLRDLARDSN